MPSSPLAYPHWVGGRGLSSHCCIYERSHKLSYSNKLFSGIDGEFVPGRSVNSPAGSILSADVETARKISIFWVRSGLAVNSLVIPTLRFPWIADVCVASGSCRSCRTENNLVLSTPWFHMSRWFLVKPIPWERLSTTTITTVRHPPQPLQQLDERQPYATRFWQ